MLYRTEQSQKTGMTGSHLVRAHYELIVQNNLHQTVKQEICLAVFYLVWQNRSPLSGKGAKGDENTASAGRGGGDLMESTQTAQRRVRYQFEFFCMKVIDGERCDYLRKLMKKMEWESSFSDLPEAVLTSICTFDNDPAEQYIFHVYGHQIPIKNDRLAEILLALGDEGYSILLLYYSLQLKDQEIASLLGLSRSKIQKDRKLLFNELKKRMVE